MMGMNPFDLYAPDRLLFPNYSPLRAPLTGHWAKPQLPPMPPVGDGEVVVWIREGGEYECPHMEYYMPENVKAIGLTDGVWVVITERTLRKWDKAEDRAVKAKCEQARLYEEARKAKK